MNKHADNQPQDANSSSLIKRLARDLSNLREAHAERTESLRVYPATRLDGRDSVNAAGQSSTETEATAPSSKGGPWRLLCKAWAAHAARLSQLRVYDPRL
mgnify:CR=1 FL=1